MLKIKDPAGRVLATVDHQVIANKLRLLEVGDIVQFNGKRHRVTGSGLVAAKLLITGNGKTMSTAIDEEWITIEPTRRRGEIQYILEFRIPTRQTLLRPSRSAR